MANKSKDVKFTPAGIKDKDVEIVAVDIKNVIDKDTDRVVLETTRSARIQVISTELTEGMTIKAYAGGKEQVKDSGIEI